MAAGDTWQASIAAALWDAEQVERRQQGLERGGVGASEQLVGDHLGRGGHGAGAPRLALVLLLCLLPSATPAGASEWKPFGLQGRQVRRRALQLPEAAGARAGQAGEGALKLRLLLERKQTIVRSIESQGKLTPELAAAIEAATTTRRRCPSDKSPHTKAARR